MFGTKKELSGCRALSFSGLTELLFVLNGAQQVSSLDDFVIFNSSSILIDPYTVIDINIKQCLL